MSGTFQLAELLFSVSLEGALRNENMKGEIMNVHNLIVIVFIVCRRYRTTATEKHV